MGAYLQSWTPYGLRPYYKPGRESGAFDESAYTEQLHASNIGLLERALETHADGGDETPWLTTGTGVVMVERSGDEGDEFEFASVYLADDRMDFRQGMHFVRQDIQVHAERGLKARTRTYPTLRRMINLFTSSDAAWSMMYPTLNHNPKAASDHIAERLASPHDLETATPEGLKEIFPLRPMALKYWVGVRLESRTS
jgi:hypothetical protein